MKPLFSAFAFTALLFTSLSFSSCGDDELVQESLPELTQIELENLQFLREEEKLARDVYAYLGTIHDHIIFDNIGASEQRHIGFVIDILDKYRIEDQGTDEPGVFNNPEIQALYNTLTLQGESSLIEALTVGATVEDLDIHDLNDALANTVNEDLTSMFQLLQCGSRNHIRAFTSQIKQEGGLYTAQFISQEQLNEILQGGHESCSSYN